MAFFKSESYGCSMRPTSWSKSGGASEEKGNRRGERLNEFAREGLQEGKGDPRRGRREGGGGGGGTVTVDGEERGRGAKERRRGLAGMGRGI